MKGSTIADEYGFYWDIPSFLVDWTNRLVLKAEQRPEWSFSALLASFDSLPGELTELLRLQLAVENRGDTLEVAVQGGRWGAAAVSHQLGSGALYGSAVKALIWLPAWRSMATGKMIRVLAEEPADPIQSDSWLLEHRPTVEVASRMTSI